MKKQPFLPKLNQFLIEALAISNISREEHLNYPEPKIVMIDFFNWVKKNSNGRPVFLSYNLAFDWSFINYYLHAYVGENPFGFSGRRIGDIYSGLGKDLFATSTWKKYRLTAHTHNPLDDAIGNAEAFLTICKKHGVKIPN